MLTFSGPWAETTWWEIHALAIVSELRFAGRATGCAGRSSSISSTRAPSPSCWPSWARLRGLDGLALSDFGTRRRHSFLWQEWAVLAMAEVLGPAFVGTSNAYLAFKHGFDAKGTNGHELPMVLAALARDNAALKASQYDLMAQWAGGLFPATCWWPCRTPTATTQFLDGGAGLAGEGLARLPAGFQGAGRSGRPS